MLTSPLGVETLGRWAFSGLARHSLVAPPARESFPSSPGEGLSLVTCSLASVFRTFASLEETNSARARRRFPVKPSFDKIQINHFVGSHCQGFTPLR